MKQFIKEIPTVYTENGMNFVLMPNGNKLPDVIKTILTDDCADSYATVMVELRCNICSTKEEALEKYGLSEVKFYSNGKITLL